MFDFCLKQCDGFKMWPQILWHLHKKSLGLNSFPLNQGRPVTALPSGTEWCPELAQERSCSLHLAAMRHWLPGMPASVPAACCPESSTLARRYVAALVDSPSPALTTARCRASHVSELTSDHMGNPKCELTSWALPKFLMICHGQNKMVVFSP